jgi:hypothetical protein
MGAAGPPTEEKRLPSARAWREEHPRAAPRPQPSRGLVDAGIPLFHDLLNTMHITTWNCRGLFQPNYKSSRLRSYLEQCRPLAVILTETHHTSDDYAHWPALAGYALHSYASNNARAGGLAFLVRDDMVGGRPSSLLAGINSGGCSKVIATTTTQCAALELHVHNFDTPIQLIGVYIQPGSHASINDELIGQLQRLQDIIESWDTAERPYVLIGGDMNSRQADSNVDSRSAADALFRELDEHYENINHQAARAAPTHTGGGALDYFLCQSPAGKEALVGSLHIDSEQLLLSDSDHYAVSAILNVGQPQLPQSHTFSKWNTDKATPEAQAAFTGALDVLCDAVDTPAAAELAESMSTLVTFHLDGRSTHTGNYRLAAGKAADKAWLALLDVVNQAARQHIGRVQRQKFGGQPGWTKELTQLSKALIHAERVLRRHPRCPEAQNAMCRARTDMQQALHIHRRARADELHAAIQEEAKSGKHNIAWASVQRKQRMQSRLPPIRAGLRKPDGKTLTTTEQESVNVLAEHFRQQLDEHSDIPEQPHPMTQAAAADSARRDALVEAAEAELVKSAPATGECIPANGDQLLTTVEDFQAILAKTSVRTAAGPDGLNGHLLRWAAASLPFMRCLCTLVNFCFFFHVLPQNWRDANMMPLLKKASGANDPNNYRPISITPIIMRRVERLIEQRVSALLDGQLQPWQAGFRKQRSTRQQVLFMHHQITEALRYSNEDTTKGTPYPVVFIDIKRAFDSVPHRFLLAKLHRAGVCGQLLHFFHAFLSGRRFRVFTHNCIGAWAAVAAGTPQGAVLSPIMYAAFIDDCLPTRQWEEAFNTSWGALLYADDICLAPARAGSVNSRHAELMGCLERLGTWGALWKVKFSDTKSNIVWFRASHTRLSEATAARRLGHQTFISYTPVMLAGHSVKLQMAPSYQYLGVWLQADLGSGTHFQHMTRKCGTVSAMLRSIQSREAHLHADTIALLTRTLLVPRATYGLPFAHLSKKQAARIDALMFKPLQTALTLPQSTHRASLSYYTGLSTTQQLRELSLLQLFGSTLKQVTIQRVHRNSANFPAFHLLKQLCHREKVQQATDSRATARQRNLAGYRQSMIAQFYATSKKWGMTSLLPSKQQFSGTAAWSLAAWRNKLKAQDLLHRTSRPLLAAAGHSWPYNGLAAAQTTHSEASERLGYGSELRPLLGGSASDAAPEDIVAVARVTTDLNHPYPLTYTHLDHRRSSQLRARLTLNRAAFKAVRHARSLDTTAAAKACSFCANRTAAAGGLPPPAETARHVLVDCRQPELLAKRRELAVKLKAVIEAVHMDLLARSLIRRVVGANPKEFFFHFLLCTPYIISCLFVNMTQNQIRDILRITGGFLEFVHSLRPF